MYVLLDVSDMNHKQNRRVTVTSAVSVFHCSHFLSSTELMLLKLLAVIPNYDIPANIEK